MQKLRKISGVSLIVLIITIVIILILSVTTIMYFSNSKVQDKSNEVAFKSNFTEYLNEFESYLGSQYADDIFADEEDINITSDKLSEIITSIKEEDKGKIRVISGKVVFIGKNEKERIWAKEIGLIVQDDTDIVIKSFLVNSTNIKEIKVTTTMEKLEKYKFVYEIYEDDGDGEFVEGKDTLFATWTNLSKIPVDKDTHTYHDLKFKASKNYIPRVVVYYLDKNAAKATLSTNTGNIISVIDPINNIPTITLEPAKAKNYWTNNDVEATIKVNDLIDGYKLQYSINGVDWKDISGKQGKVTIPENNTTVQARLYSISLDDSTTPVKVVVDYIDKESPEIEYASGNSSELTTSDLILKVNVFDSLSGVGTLKVGNDSVDVSNGVGSYTVSKNGSYKFEVTDNAGNINETTVTVDKIDKTQYTITYNLGGGTVSGNPESYNVSTPTFTLNNPSKTGYSFKGWTGSNGNNAETTVSIAKGSQGNKSYTANYDPNTYTITYHGNGATGGSTKPSTHEYDKAKALTANGFGRGYTVTYNYNGNGQANTNATATYTFKNWNIAQAGTSTSYTDKQSVTNLATSGNVNLYAQWNEASVTLPTPNARVGYTFGGWYSDSGLTKSVGGAGATYTPTAPLTLYAKWVVNPYQVTYDYSTNGGTSATKTSAVVNYGSSVDLTPTATKSGWTFVGWNTSSTATTPLTSLNMPAGGVKLYAIYKKDVKATFNYYNNLSTTVTKTMYNTATSVTITAPGTLGTPNNYSFRGWSTIVAGNAIVAVSSSEDVNISSDTSYYASYSYTVTGTYYYYNGSAYTNTSKTATAYMNYVGTKIGGTPAAPTTSTPSGWTNRGWSTSQAANATVATPSSITSNVTYYYSWQRTVTVSYNANGGAGAPAASTGTAYLNYKGSATNASITLSTTKPSKTGHTFTGWNTKADGLGTAYSAGGTCASALDVTLYAQWQDATSPSVSFIVTTSDNQIVVTASGTDNVGVTSYEFYINGNLMQNSASNVYSFTPSATTYDKYGNVTGTSSATSDTLYAPGYGYNVKVVAKDAAGNSGESSKAAYKANSSSISITPASTNSYYTNITVSCSILPYGNLYVLQYSTNGTTWTTVSGTSATISSVYSGSTVYARFYSSSLNDTTSAKSYTYSYDSSSSWGGSGGGSGGSSGGGSGGSSGGGSGGSSGGGSTTSHTHTASCYTNKTVTNPNAYTTRCTVANGAHQGSGNGKCANCGITLWTVEKVLTCGYP